MKRVVEMLEKKEVVVQRNPLVSSNASWFEQMYETVKENIGPATGTLLRMTVPFVILAVVGPFLFRTVSFLYNVNINLLQLLDPMNKTKREAQRRAKDIMKTIEVWKVLVFYSRIYISPFLHRQMK